MEDTIYDSDIRQEKLDELIASKPELAILKYMGEIPVELDGNMTREDNRFDAPYQEGWVVGGSIDDVVEDLKVYWNPTESDLEHVMDGLEPGEEVPACYQLMKNLLMSEPKANVQYDITSVISSKRIEELEEAYVEKNRED